MLQYGFQLFKIETNGHFAFVVKF